MIAATISATIYVVHQTSIHFDSKKITIGSSPSTTEHIQVLFGLNLKLKQPRCLKQHDKALTHFIKLSGHFIDSQSQTYINIIRGVNASMMLS